MLIFLGFSMVAVFMYMILTKRLTPTLALILVPLTFALIVTVTGVGEPGEEGVVDSIMSSIADFAPTATLLFFAIIFFGTMIDVGLFDPMIGFILRAVRNDPVRLVVFTAVLAGLVSLDGDGSTTFIITVSALLPIYLKLGMSPVVLTVVANLANGVLNILPHRGRAGVLPGPLGAPPPAGVGSHAGAGRGIAERRVAEQGAGGCRGRRVGRGRPRRPERG